jgi:hypothetical protein
VGGAFGAWVGVGRVRRSGGGCGKAGDVVVLVGLERVCVCVCVRMWVSVSVSVCVWACMCICVVVSISLCVCV